MQHFTQPPVPSKTIVLPGILYGLFLASLQMALMYFFWHLNEDIGAILLLTCPLYFLMPAIAACTWANHSRQARVGFRIGRLTGATCALLLFFATLIAIGLRMEPLQNGMIAGAAIVASILFNFFGAVLALAGSFLGSKVRVSRKGIAI